MPQASDRAASALNRELTQMLVDAGDRLGFSAVREYFVPGGRLDVVWTWEPNSPFPGLDQAVPVVGFEIESSWRTRKHVKGDLLNLQDAAGALGVIVLAGADARDDSLRRFAAALVDHPGARVLIWTEHEVRALAAGEDMRTVVETLAIAAASGISQASPTTGTDHGGKWKLLWEWLRLQERHPFRISILELERQVGITLPDSCHDHAAHWHSYQGSAVARAVLDAGWHASRVDTNTGEVSLVPGPPPGLASPL